MAFRLGTIEHSQGHVVMPGIDMSACVDSPDDYSSTDETTHSNTGNINFFVVGRKIRVLVGAQGKPQEAACEACCTTAHTWRSASTPRLLSRRDAASPISRLYRHSNPYGEL